MAILVGLLLFLVFLKLVRSYYYPNRKPTPQRLPPGPWQLPIIGSLHHLLGSALPHHALRDLSLRHGPLMLLKLGEVPTLVVSSSEAAREVMKTHDAVFASRHLSVTIGIFSYGGRDVLFGPYSDHWRQLRKICVLELFSARRVQSFRPIREEEVARLVRSIADEAASEGGEGFNLSEKISVFMNDVVVRSAIGGRCKRQAEFLRELDLVVELIGGFNMADLFPSSRLARRLSGTVREAERCHRNMHRIMQSIIEEHEVCDTEEDLLAVLLRLQQEGGLQFPLTTDAITAVITVRHLDVWNSSMGSGRRFFVHKDVFAAGSETSSTTLEWAMSELMSNPRVMKKVQLEVRQSFEGRAKIKEEDVGKLSYLQMVLKETLRLHPPGPLLLRRECQETCRVMGYDIPKGTTVFVNVWAIGRDPKYWEDAAEFKPERFKESTMDFKGTHFEYIPFGAGRRICPGTSFGLANIELALASLLYYFDWELPPSMKHEPLDMTETFGITARRKSKLWLHAKTLNIRYSQP